METLKIKLKMLLRMNTILNNIDERIQEIQQSIYPKAQTISDMPKGGGRIGGLDEYILKIEMLQEKKQKMQNKICEKDNEIQAILLELDATKTEQYLIELKYYKGLTWAKVAEITQIKQSKCFRMLNKLFTKDKERIEVLKNT